MAGTSTNAVPAALSDANQRNALLASNAQQLMSMPAVAPMVDNRQKIAMAEPAGTGVFPPQNLALVDEITRLRQALNTKLYGM